MVLPFMILLSSSFCWAQESTELFELGVKQYLSGEYETAIVTWQKAYVDQPAAILLYNMALASSKLGNFAQAKVYARRSDQERNFPLQKDTRAKNLANFHAWQIHATSTQTLKREQALSSPKSVTETSQWGWKGNVGVVAMTVGAAGIVFSLLLNSELSELRSSAAAATTIEEFRSLESSHQQKATWQGIGTIGGGVFLVFGSTLVVWDVLTIETHDVRLAVSPSSTGFSVVMEF